jgi:hypothetical protein
LHRRWCGWPLYGKGYSLGIIDDPYKGPGDAASPALRQKLIDWLRSVWLTRAEPAMVLGPDGSEQPTSRPRWWCSPAGTTRT